MALQKSFFDQFGVDHPKGYWRLTSFVYDNYQQTADLTLSCYASREAADAKMQPLTTKSFHLVNEEYAAINDLLTAGFKQQVYEFVKTKEEPDGTIFFEGADDV